MAEKETALKRSMTKTDLMGVGGRQRDKNLLRMNTSICKALKGRKNIKMATSIKASSKKFPHTFIV